MTDDYVEFHARSAFSFLEGASLPEALVEQAAKLGIPALGILDRDGLYGAPRLYTTAKKLGLRSHVGAEVSVSDLGLQMQPAFKLVLVFASLAGRTDIPASWLDSCADTDCRYARNACQLGEVGPSCNGLFGLLENRGRVLYAMLLRKAE